MYQFFNTRNRGAADAITDGRLQTGNETESWKFVGERKCSPREMKLLASSMIAMGGASAVRVFKSRRGGSGELVYEAVSA